MDQSPPPTGSSPHTSQSGRRDVVRLHIGGETPREGWKILNVQAKPGTDHVGTCTDLSQFQDNSIEEIYASHVYEHLSYQGELQRAIAEAYRVLVPWGVLRAGVPDMEILCRLYLEKRLTLEQRFHVQRMMLGGQVDQFDFHKVGLDFPTFASFLTRAGFKDIRRVEKFGIFEDTTNLRFAGVPVSLNVMARK